MLTIEENEYFLTEKSIRYLDLGSSLLYEPVLFSFAYVIVKQQYLYNRHVHPSFEIIIPEKKAYKCFLNYCEINILPGEFLVVQEGDVHQDIFVEGMEYCALTFHMKNPDLPGKENTFLKKGCAPEKQKAKLPGEGSSYHEAYALLKKEAAEGAGDFSYYILNGLFKVVFWKLAELFPESSLTPVFIRSTGNERFKNRLLECFDLNIGRKLSIGNMASFLNMSESSLAHKAKSAFGISPAKAFMGYKMKRAVRLLSESDITVKEVSEMLGFEDQFHFSKAFKKHFGESPSIYR